MLCKKCNQPNPSHARKCNACEQTFDVKAASVHEIKTDMFGNQISTIKPNKSRIKKRAAYLTTLPEMNEIKAERARQEKQVNRDMLQIAGIAGGLFLFIALIVAIVASPKMALLPLMMLGTAMLGIFDGAMKLKADLPELKFTGDMSIHNAMPRYYGSDRVFGHVNGAKNGYNNCEIDLKEIETVGYDDHYQEYLVKMKNPAYMDYAVSADKTFRIADIFDKDTLPKVITNN